MIDLSVLWKLASWGSAAAWKEIVLFWEVDDEHRKLLRTLCKIQDLVDQAECRRLSISGRSKAWQLWFEELRKLAYDAEALVDRVSLNLVLTSFPNSTNDPLFSLVLSSLSSVDLPHKINGMHRKLEEHVEEMKGLLMIEKLKQDSSMPALRRSADLSYADFSSLRVDENSIVGRDQDTELIVNLLLQENRSPVVLEGMAGIGKTAIAQLVYNDERIQYHFSWRIWVNVPMEFDVVEITKSMLKFAPQHAPRSLTDLNSLQLELQRAITRQMVLLVLDDYGSEMCDDWDILLEPFRSAGGCSILVTTRSNKVSSIIHAHHTHRLDVLSDGECWDVMSRRIWGNGDRDPSLERIGRQIARRYQGLPLAAVSLGNVMCHQTTPGEWRSILESEFWDVLEDTKLFHRLMLSYIHLPLHLKMCFAYCSIFPKDYVFDADELVSLWRAEGFIQCEGAQSWEALGNRYFKDLCSRFFFQPLEAAHRRVFKMHGLVHDMARFVSKDICFQCLTNRNPLFGKTCHMSLLHDSDHPIKLKAPIKNKRLRTFLVRRNNRGDVQIDPTLFHQLKYLRVLGLSSIGLRDLPESIVCLIFIRYLNLSKNPLTHLPKDMRKLIALQTLKLADCSELTKLPEDIIYLSNLWHLELDAKSQLQCMPKEFGRLINLRTLPVYVVGRPDENRISELKNIKELRGSLCIKNLDRVSAEASEAREAQLAEKKSLDKLELEWRKMSDELNVQFGFVEASRQLQVFQNLEPHQNLKELVIANYRGATFPDWLSQASRQFTSITLQGLECCEELPSLGKLHSLKFFAISDMPRVVSIGDSFYGDANAEEFPSLESFQLRNMPALTNWANDIRPNAMPQLTAFTLHDCPLLASLPQRLQNLRGGENANIIDCPNLPH